MSKAFQPKGKLSVRDWGKGLLIFSFENREDRDWVIKNQPWHFDGHLFVVKILFGIEQPSTIQITSVSFWIRAYDIPPLCHTEMVLKQLAGRVGILEGYDKASDIGVLCYMRFKVAIDLSKPLLKGVTVKLGGEQLWIPFKYESLPSYCYCCGLIGHFFRKCKFYDRDENLSPDEISFGPSLKAPQVRGGRDRYSVFVAVNHGTSKAGKNNTEILKPC
ncbi:hypothetical protein ACS0TY_030652 [Phlomoides rotata]